MMDLNCSMQRSLILHYAVNMRATLLLAVEFARRAKALDRLSGRIISMSSGQDWGPMPGELAYAATKGAIEAFTLSLASELAPLGITVNAVDPGPTDTGWMTDQMRREWGVPSGSSKVQSAGRCRPRNSLPRQRCRPPSDRAGDSRTGETI